MKKIIYLIIVLILAILNFTLIGCKNKYTLSFNSFSENTIEDIEFLEGFELNEEETPVTIKEGYIFIGWYLDENYQNPVVYPYAINENTCLYAKWEEVPSNIEILTYRRDENTLSITGLSNKYDNRKIIVIPNEIMGSKVTSIGESAFQDKYFIEEIIISESVERIEMYAFKNCYNLKRININKNVNFIDYEVFSGYNKTKISVDDENKYFIDFNGAFCSIAEKLLIKYSSPLEDENADLDNFKIPEGISYIGDYAFYGNKFLKNIDFNNQILVIGNHAFEDCQIKNIYNSDSVESIGFRAFMDTPLEIDGNIDENGMIYLGNTLYKYRGSRTIIDDSIIPSFITKIADEAFFGTNIQYIDLREIRITSIGMRAFSNCPDLQTIKLGDEIENISYAAISNCANLINIDINCLIPPQIDASVFSNNNENMVINVPYAFKDIYKNRQYYDIYEDNISSVLTNIELYVSDEEIYYLNDIEYYNSLSNLPIPQEKIGYDFDGWSRFDQDTNKTIKYYNGDFWNLDEDTTLYANWKPKVYFINMDTNGGARIGVLVAYYNMPLNTLPMPEKFGYKLIGWYDEDNNLITEDTIWNIEENYTLFAKWEPQKYNIILDADADDITLDDNIIEVTFNEFYNLPVLSRENYDFIGWASEKNGTGIIYSLADGRSINSYNSNVNKIIYAQWNPIT